MIPVLEEKREGTQEEMEILMAKHNSLFAMNRFQCIQEQLLHSSPVASKRDFLRNHYPSRNLPHILQGATHRKVDPGQS
jgi:hypothetical protein